MSPTYEEISPLVESATRMGRTMLVVFKCPETGKKVSSRGTVESTRRIDVLSAHKNYQAWQLRKDVASQVSRFLGSGIAGQLGSRAVYGASRKASSPAKGESAENIYSEADEQRAVLDAFRTVAHRFEQTQEGGWRIVAPSESSEPRPGQVGATAGGRPTYGRNSPLSAGSERPSYGNVRPALAESTPQAPQETPAASPSADDGALYDVLGLAQFSTEEERQLLSRVMLEVASTHAGVDEHEAKFMAALEERGLPSAWGDGPIYRLEASYFEGMRPEIREPLYLVAAVFGWIDGQLSFAERSRLASYRKWMGVERAQADTLELAAKKHVLRVHAHLLQRPLSQIRMIAHRMSLTEADYKEAVETELA